MNDRKEVTLVVPDSLIEMSVSAVKLCELFTATVLDEAKAEIDVSVDSETGAVNSNSQAIRELLSMYLKSKQLPLFYGQLKALAFMADGLDEFALKLIVGGAVWHVSIRELCGLPNIRLNITKMDMSSLK